MDMMLESMFSKFGQTYEPNQIIFCENEPGNNFFLIQSGKVKIVKTVPNPTKERYDRRRRRSFYRISPSRR